MWIGTEAMDAGGDLYPVCESHLPDERAPVERPITTDNND